MEGNAGMNTPVDATTYGLYSLSRCGVCAHSPVLWQRKHTGAGQGDEANIWASKLQRAEVLPMPLTLMLTLTLTLTLSLIPGLTLKKLF